jgi:hypothetical protein
LGKSSDLQNIVNYFLALTVFRLLKSRVLTVRLQQFPVEQKGAENG